MTEMAMTEMVMRGAAIIFADPLLLLVRLPGNPFWDGAEYLVPIYSEQEDRIKLVPIAGDLAHALFPAQVAELLQRRDERLAAERQRTDGKAMPRAYREAPR